jgi:hypothetical protein
MTIPRFIEYSAKLNELLDDATAALNRRAHHTSIAARMTASQERRVVDSDRLRPATGCSPAIA